MHPASQFWLLPPLAKMVLYRMQNSGLTLWDVRLGTWCFLTELFIQEICFKSNPTEHRQLPGASVLSWLTMRNPHQEAEEIILQIKQNFNRKR